MEMEWKEIATPDLRLPFFEARIDTALPVSLDMNRVYFVLIKKSLYLLISL